MKISKKVRDLRKQNNLTLKELSEKSGLSVSFISDIENERRNPSIEKLQDLAKALGVSADEFLKDDTNENMNIPKEYTDKYTITKRDLNQHDNVLEHAQTFMMDDTVDEKDKEKLFERVNKLYWKAKANNKEKYGKKKDKE
ncbi:helix-turn-helix domain-containing protein [Clostridium sp. DJ247]|uniref:helix-turn-helix domain-containing protein n=1 Tax=Clostridium sp. DJ247 TaxID=2726188 RepID=UPI00162485EF|nr:helix-turn-helix transcriptional regulator [Clostridium sp. DJ247]MBC2581876.1 helix-turn-helix transcriptional regulator [Clostridium sp. DJ247]